MSDTIDEDTKEKELRSSNSSIKVHVPLLSILLNSFIVNSIKQKLTLSSVLSMLDLAKHDPQSSPYQTEPEEN